MTVHIEGVPFNRILTFPFRDATSIKRFLVVAGLSLACFLIPILPGLFVAGYSVRILRRAIQEGKVEMPEWSDETRLLIDGLYSTVIGLVYLLPGILTLIAGFFLYFVSFMLVIPSADSADTASFLTIFIPMAILFLSICLGAGLMFLGAIPYPIALARFADEGRLGAAFQIREIFRSLKKNPAGYFGAWVVCFGLIYILYFIYLISYLSVILCCPGYLVWIIGSYGAGCVFLAMIGLAYRQGKTV
jgi:hypothetical protein